MPRPLIDKEALAILDSQATYPSYYVEWKHNGTSTEYLGSAGPDPVSELGATVVEGAVEVIGFSGDGMAVSLRVPATAARITQVQNGTWRNQICELWINERYSEPDPGVPVYAVQIFNGVIDSSSYDGSSVVVTAKQRSMVGKMTPIISYADCCNHMPPPGEILAWVGEQVVIQQPTYSPPTSGERFLVLGTGDTGPSTSTSTTVTATSVTFPTLLGDDDDRELVTGTQLPDYLQPFNAAAGLYT